MPDTPTFGRYAEMPLDRMTPRQREGYRFLIDSPRERLPGGRTPGSPGLARQAAAERRAG